jgi:hypothetical protein
MPRRDPCIEILPPLDFRGGDDDGRATGKRSKNRRVEQSLECPLAELRPKHPECLEYIRHPLPAEPARRIEADRVAEPENVRDVRSR